ncbi:MULTISPECIES: twin-arginine translocation signal domain-containing protein [unclassified Streptomyces]|uniref:twin-arginine translocation signal domain-containing protein n=1 Tax=unclassified Streptomyces TaxID=2593676 RepID=UPI0037190E19
MSSISRRSLLGYSGTAAAGAVVGTATSAEQAQAAETETASAVFPEGELFTGGSSIGDVDTYLTIRFSVETNATDASGNQISPGELADLLSDFAVSRGWPAVTFYGRPVPAKLN